MTRSAWPRPSPIVALGVAAAVSLGLSMIFAAWILQTPPDARDPAAVPLVQSLVALGGVLVAGAGIALTLAREEVARRHVSETREKSRIEDALDGAHGPMWAEAIQWKLDREGPEGVSAMLGAARVTPQQLAKVAPAAHARFEMVRKADAEREAEKRRIAYWAHLDPDGVAEYEHREMVRENENENDAAEAMADQAAENEKNNADFVAEMREKYLGEKRKAA